MNHQEAEVILAMLQAINEILPHSRKNKVVQSKLNTERNNPAWKGTISIRCSKLQDNLVAQCLNLIFAAVAPAPTVLDRVGLNLSVVYDPHTKEKSIVEGHRTIYLTLRPSKETFDFILKKLGYQEEYDTILNLQNVLYEHKYKTEEQP